MKTRIIAGSQQVVRADWESIDDLNGDVESKVMRVIGDVLANASAVVLSDYAKGALTPNVIETTIRLAAERDVPVLVDPKLRRYRLYKRITLLTPNLVKRSDSPGWRSTATTTSAWPRVRSSMSLGCRAVLITRGEHGMSLFEAGEPPIHIPTLAREVFDVSGAGRHGDCRRGARARRGRHDSGRRRPREPRRGNRRGKTRHRDGRAERARLVAAARRNQCLKWRFPVSTMAMPRSLAAAMTSSSRTEPPG